MDESQNFLLRFLVSKTENQMRLRLDKMYNISITIEPMFYVDEAPN